MIKIEEELKVEVNSAELLRLFHGCAEEYLKGELSMLAHEDVRNVQVIDLVPIFNGNRELLTFLIESYELQGFLAVSRYTEDVLSSRVYITDEFINKHVLTQDILKLSYKEESEQYLLDELIFGYNNVYKYIKKLTKDKGNTPFNLIDLIDKYADSGACTYAEVIKDCFLLSKHGYISFIFNGFLDTPAIMLTDKK